MNKEALQQYIQDYRRIKQLEKTDYYTHQLDRDFILEVEIPNKSISSDIDKMNP